MRTVPGGPDDPRGLGAFALEYELTMSGAGYRQKVAVGVNRLGASSPDQGAALWAVRVGTAPGQPISYSISHAAGQPHLFAPRPLSNELISRQHVPIRDYATGTGLSAQPNRKLNFADTDLDVWGRMLLAAVDELLSPEFTAPIQLVSRATGADWLAELLAQKSKLATAISKWMIPLYKSESADPSAVRAAYYQQLLSTLSTAYEIKAGIQFTASVSADAVTSGVTPPQLFGAVHDAAAEGLSLLAPAVRSADGSPQTTQRSDITLTSPKLGLEPKSGVPLPVLMSAPDTVTVDGAVVGAVELALTWKPSAIEHQIASVPGIATYVASSWLSFVVPGEELHAALGAFSVPIVLRSFPAAPAVVGQAGQATHVDTADLSAVTKWTYDFTWSLPFHYVQDRVHGVVEFNVAPGGVGVQAAPDLFDALAEFVTVYPHVRVDLDTILAPIETTSSEKAFSDAGVALGAFVELLSMVNGAAGGADGLALAVAGAGLGAVTEYEFEVVEGADDHGNLLITVISHSPTGGGAPVVDLAGYKAELVQPVVAGRHSYRYQAASGGYLSQAQGQQIADRTLALPGLDALQRQDAWASVWVTRNEQIIEEASRLAAPFVYTTSHTRFAEPLMPIIDSAALIDLARIGQVAKPSLDEYLNLLFTVLFADVPPDVTSAQIGVEASYLYPVLQAAEPVQLPIFFQPLLSVIISGSGETRTQMVRHWSEAITDWQREQAPVTAGARLHFDLTIFSSLPAQTMPLVRLRNLELAIADIG